MMKCLCCKRTPEQVLREDGEVELSNIEAFICKTCKKIEEHKSYMSGIRKMFNVDKLEQENQALKDRWEKLKEYIDIHCVDKCAIKKMKELEKEGSK